MSKQLHDDNQGEVLLSQGKVSCVVIHRYDRNNLWNHVSNRYLNVKLSKLSDFGKNFFIFKILTLKWTRADSEIHDWIDRSKLCNVQSWKFT